VMGVSTSPRLSELVPTKSQEEVIRGGRREEEGP
jgi:hypothetical protein